MPTCNLWSRIKDLLKGIQIIDQTTVNRVWGTQIPQFKEINLLNFYQQILRVKKGCGRSWKSKQLSNW